MMRSFALILISALVAVQARSNLVNSNGAVAVLGENPSVVHLRIATGSSGLLRTCTGSLIGERWVITSASCVANSRFIWVRYGMVDVTSPSLVTENNIVSMSRDGILGIININRSVHPTANYSPVALTSSEDFSGGRVCLFGATESGEPGESLSCYNVDDLDSEEIAFNDEGAGVVKDGVLYAVFARGLDSISFTSIVPYLSWIQSTTGLSPPDNDDASAYRVNVIN